MSQQQFDDILLQCVSETVQAVWYGHEFWRDWKRYGTVPAGAD